jgi:hypothetical protein
MANPAQVGRRIRNLGLDVGVQHIAFAATGASGVCDVCAPFRSLTMRDQASKLAQEYTEHKARAKTGCRKGGPSHVSRRIIGIFGGG